MDDKTAKQIRELEETAEVMAAVRKLKRKNFDYQERWHGFASPVGLGIGFALVGLGTLFFALAFSWFR